MRRIPAERWYRVRRIGDGVTRIDEPFVREFRRRGIWHVRGRDRDLPVDGGVGVVSPRRHVPPVTEKPCLAVASHTRFDRSGGRREFPDRPVHAAAAEILARPARAATPADPRVADAIFEALPPEPYLSAEHRVEGAPATRIVEDGDVVDLGDRRFEVIHTPDRWPGGVALFERETGILFSGDIVHDGPLVEDTCRSDAADHFASTKRLLEPPVRVFHGGRFPSYDGARHRQIVRARPETGERS